MSYIKIKLAGSFAEIDPLYSQSYLNIVYLIKIQKNIQTSCYVLEITKRILWPNKYIYF